MPFTATRLPDGCASVMVVAPSIRKAAMKTRRNMVALLSRSCDRWVLPSRRTRRSGIDMRAAAERRLLSCGRAACRPECDQRTRGSGHATDGCDDRAREQQPERGDGGDYCPRRPDFADVPCGL